MSAHQSTARAPRAAIYVRMTTPSQEDSPQRQREQCIPYALGKGYRLVADPNADGYPYIDLAIRGEDDSRPGYQRLLADVQNGLIDVIVCDEWSRFSRSEPEDFIADVVRPMKRAGVSLDTVKNGVQEWQTLAGLIMAVVNASQASGESKTISGRVLSNSRTRVKDGRAAGGGAPFGYRWEYEEVTVKGKRKLSPVRLVPDGLKADIVRQLFNLYDTGFSVMDLVEWLEERGVAPPRAGKRGRTRWSRSSVRAVLRNVVYTGRYYTGRRTRAKHSEVRGDVVVPRAASRRPGHLANGRPRKTVAIVPNPEETWVVSPVRHEALVTQEVFDRVQAKLAKNRDGRNASVRDGYVLSGLLVCEHCGRTLVGHLKKGVLEYNCTSVLDGHAGACNNARIRQDKALNVIGRKLEETFLNPAHLDALREEYRRQEEEAREPDNLDQLRQQMVELDGQVARIVGNMALLEPDEIPAARQRRREIEARRDALAAELSQAEGQRPAGQDLEEQIRLMETYLFRFKEAVRVGDPRALREVLDGMVARVAVRWAPCKPKAPKDPNSRYTHRPCAGGTIYTWLGADTPGAQYGSPFCAQQASGLHAIDFTAADLSAVG